MYACLAVTCHLHFWQNDRDFLRATVVTRGWNGYRNKSQHRKSTLEKKILPPFQQGFEPATFQSRVRRSNHWAIPAPIYCEANHVCYIEDAREVTHVILMLLVEQGWSLVLHGLLPLHPLYNIHGLLHNIWQDISNVILGHKYQNQTGYIRYSEWSQHLQQKWPIQSVNGRVLSTRSIVSATSALRKSIRLLRNQI